jgi:dTDP-4-amino-4,6-dideoxygalactose transaminase
MRLTLMENKKHPGITKEVELLPEIRIPFEDLKRQYQALREEITVALDEVLPTGKYTMGPFLNQFEAEFGAYTGTKYCAGISNGTEALHMGLLACGVGPGDEVITVPNTYIATVFAITYTGATPVFADVDPVTFNLDPEQVEAHITPRTKAILPVHMYGHPVDIDPILALARKHHLYVVEDAAHAHGAMYKGRKAGALGDLGCFSFYPTKVMGAYGDGGAVTGNDPDLSQRVRQLRYMGQHVKYCHEIIGYQQRLGDLQANILRVKLRHLEQCIADRRRAAATYYRLLQGTPVIAPVEVGDVRHVYYMYTIRAPRRDQLQAFLAERGIGSSPVYPLPVPYQPAYAFMGHKDGDFPVSDAHYKEILCLPMFPELTDEEIGEVTQAIRDFYGC